MPLTRLLPMPGYKPQLHPSVNIRKDIIYPSREKSEYFPDGHFPCHIHVKCHG